ncbi:MAG: alanine--tRNA ligase [Candidatus Woesebacteria bacterium]
MNAQQIRKAYLDFYKDRGHVIVPRALLVPQNDPTTLFTGSGMQPMIPYLLGEEHPDGVRIADSQTCVRAQDIDDVGDNRHTTFFEMLGNWSLGDYFKAEQLPWMYEFLLDVVKLDVNKIYATCFIGDERFNIPKDTESADLIKKIFADRGVDAQMADIGSEEDGYKRGIKPGERIFYYDGYKNWWWRGKGVAEMANGEPGGPSSEMFYRFDDSPHTPNEVKEYGEHCHPNCDCGRFMEIGNNVFMEYMRRGEGFEKLPKHNVDQGSGLERIAAAAINSPDVFKISLLWPIIEKIQQLSGKDYDSNTNAMRVIADHLRGATFLAVDDIVPSNKEQGYVMRRLMRRAIRFAFDLGIEQDFVQEIVPVVTGLYKNDFPEVAEREQQVIDALAREEKVFRQTLRKGLVVLNKIADSNKGDNGEIMITGDLVIFPMYDTYGFPVELVLEEAFKNGWRVHDDWRAQFERKMTEQRERSRTAGKGEFKGGLADHGEITTKYHTAAHLMYKALKMVLGNHVVQRGSNITAERIRFDFSHPQKVTPDELKKVEDIVNEQITKDWPVGWREENAKQALANGVSGAFGDKYGEVVKVYTVGDPDGENYSREICGGPHVTHTGALSEDGKRFKILKEEASSAGVRRIKAALV